MGDKCNRSALEGVKSACTQIRNPAPGPIPRVCPFLCQLQVFQLLLAPIIDPGLRGVVKGTYHTVCIVHGISAGPFDIRNRKSSDCHSGHHIRFIIFDSLQVGFYIFYTIRDRQLIFFSQVLPVHKIAALILRAYGRDTIQMPLYFHLRQRLRRNSLLKARSIHINILI